MTTNPMAIYCAHPISGRSADDVFEYYQRLRQSLEPYYRVLIPMTGKGSLRTEVAFRAEGYRNDPLTTNHAIFERDRWMVTQADVVYVNLIGTVDRVSIGCLFEMAWASILGKYVVLALDNPSINQHAFVLEAADVVFESADAAEAYLVTLAGGAL